MVLSDIGQRWRNSSTQSGRGGEKGSVGGGDRMFWPFWWQHSQLQGVWSSWACEGAYGKSSWMCPNFWQQRQISFALTLTGGKWVTPKPWCFHLSWEYTFIILRHLFLNLISWRETSAVVQFVSCDRSWCWRPVSFVIRPWILPALQNHLLPNLSRSPNTENDDEHFLSLAFPQNSCIKSSSEQVMWICPGSCCDRLPCVGFWVRHGRKRGRCGIR